MGGSPKCFYFQFVLFVLVCLGVFTTVATPLYLYFQVLCQVLASNVEGDKSCDLLPENRLCALQFRESQKSPDHLFDLIFLHNMLHTIFELSLVLSFLIWATEVPAFMQVSQPVLFSQISALQLHLLLLCTLFMVFWGKTLNKVG